MATVELIPFKVGEASPANTFLAIWMARAAGFYEDQGLALEIVKMVGGSQCGPALMAGDIDLMHIGMSSVVRANTAGADVRTIGSLSNVIRSAMFTAPGINTAEDLKGGVVGISSVGSESDPTTTLALGRIGLTRADVTVKEIGVERFAAVRDGKVSATMLGEPQRSAALAAGLHAMVDLLADNIPWLYSGLVVKQATLADHGDTLARFMRATVEGNYLAINDAARAKDVLARELNLTDGRIIDITYANFKASTPANADLTRPGAENIIATVAAPDASHDPDDYMDSWVLDQLRGEGFFDAMEKKYGTP
jgi:ABC-type nitrate/sulfonate/bicarbonate transport system substrate-binding protein